MPSVLDRKTVQRRRALVSQIKEFGQREFGLPRTKNFSRYYPGRSWCFFVQWCSQEKIWEKDEDVDERLFFDKKEAINFCHQKTNEGLDAFVFKAIGFIDEQSEKISGSPLTSKHITMERLRLAPLIFHEDFHVWIKRSRSTNISADNKIEESLAEVFGDIATVLWLQSTGVKIDDNKFYKEEVKNAVMVCRVYDLLKRIYKNTSLGSDIKKSLKKKIFNKYKKVISMGPDWCLYKRVNFASLYVVYGYSKYVKLFYDFFRTFGDLKNINLKMALRQIKITDKKSKSPEDFIRRVKEFIAKNKNNKK